MSIRLPPSEMISFDVGVISSRKSDIRVEISCLLADRVLHTLTEVMAQNFDSLYTDSCPENSDKSTLVLSAMHMEHSDIPVKVYFFGKNYKHYLIIESNIIINSQMDKI